LASQVNDAAWAEGSVKAEVDAMAAAPAVKRRLRDLEALRFFMEAPSFLSGVNIIGWDK
jgi:hypothetical protein